MTTTRAVINRIAVAGFLAILGIPLLLILLTLQLDPAVATLDPLTETQRAEVEQLLVDSAPGNVYDSQLRQLSLTSGELNLLLRYTTEIVDRNSSINGQILLPGQDLLAGVSVPIKSRILPLYLNVSTRFASDGEALRLTSLKIGRLQIPGSWVQRLAAQVEQSYLEELATYRDIQELLSSVQQIEVTANRLQLEFMWEPDLIGKVRNQAQKFLVSDADQQRIARYHQRITEIINTIPTTTRAIPLSTLLAPLFADAQHLARLGEDPIAENRALILSAAAYVNEENIERWLKQPLASRLTNPRSIEVRMQRRQDLAQHVMSSAAIAASAGMGVARIISSVKENYDARYRSGFSFSDLTANTAGMAIGNLATQSRGMAMEIQQRMATLESDADILPPLDSNHDGISEIDFSAQYRNENSSDYQARLQEIEALVFERPLFRGLRGD